MRLAVDPGKMSGFAYCPEPVDRQLPEIVTGELAAMELLDWVWISRGKFTRIVCESFTITAQTLKKSRQADPLEIIGALRWMMRGVGTTLVLQSPSVAKGFVRDDTLKRLGMWHRSDHARDATRHLITDLVETRQLDPRVLKEA